MLPSKYQVLHKLRLLRNPPETVLDFNMHEAPFHGLHCCGHRGRLSLLDSGVLSEKGNDGPFQGSWDQEIRGPVASDGSLAMAAPGVTIIGNRPAKYLIFSSNPKCLLEFATLQSKWQ